MPTFPRSVLRPAAPMALAALALLHAEPALAHGVVGDRMFMEPFVAEDANPANECDVLLPTWQDGAAFTEGFAIEKTLLPDLSLGLSFAPLWTAPVPGTPGSFGNPTFELKHSLYKNDDHEFITSLGLALAPPVIAGAGTNWNFAPVWSFARGLGDLPDSVGLLRPFLVQGDIDGDLPFGPGAAGAVTDLNFKVALAYSLPYLQQEVRYLGIPAPFSDMLPQVEVDLNQPFSGPGGTAFNGRILPGVIWIGNYTEVGLAGVIPVNGASGGYGAVGILDLFLDDMFPSSYGKPLF